MSAERAASDTRVTVGTVLMPLLFVFVFGVPVSHYMGMARSLQIPAASSVMYAPYDMLIAYWSCLVIFKFGRMARHRFKIAVAAAVLVTAWPVVLVHAMSISLPLPRWLEPAERDRLKAVFPHPHAYYSASGEGTVVRIRRGDDPEPIKAFIQSLPAKPPDHSSTP